MLGPALAITLLFFGGGLALGALQALGHMPAAGFDTLTKSHFTNALIDPDFATSLALTFYVALGSTLIAAAISVLAALALMRLSEQNRVANFIFQIPLTVPHLVVAVSVLFLLAPSGMISRLTGALGLTGGALPFPVLTNDDYGIGIMAAYVWKEVPFITLMIVAALKNSGLELLDVGATLKAGPWQRFRFIIVPIIFPSLGAASLITFAYTFGAFEVPYLLGKTHPTMLPVTAYKLYSDVDLMARPQGIATGIVIAVVVAAAVVFSQFLTKTARRRGAAL